MNERLTYHSLEELQALTLEDLRAIWELVPTDRQHAYRLAYDREVRRYDESALAPVGSRWARTLQGFKRRRVFSASP
jgi:hypothetical protein